MVPGAAINPSLPFGTRQDYQKVSSRADQAADPVIDRENVLA
jgi:hypothetical protein